MTSPIDVTSAPVRRPGETGKTGIFWRPGLSQSGGGGGSGGGATDIVIDVSGPFFAGQAPGFVTQMLDDIKYYIVSQVLADWQLNMDRSFKHPTPYYETQVMVQRVSTDWVVHDRGIIYGPWLEGVSLRNQTTRFKGYASMRRAVQSVVRHKARPIVNRIVREYVGRMNG